MARSRSNVALEEGRKVAASLFEWTAVLRKKGSRNPQCPPRKGEAVSRCYFGPDQRREGQEWAERGNSSNAVDAEPIVSRDRSAPEAMAPTGQNLYGMRFEPVVPPPVFQFWMTHAVPSTATVPYLMPSSRAISTFRLPATFSA
jgi:hypothetical protein